MAEGPFKDNVVILTGASSGIGRALAIQLAERGAWLALAARNVEALDEVAAECRKVGAAHGVRVATQCADVSDEAQCQRLVERTALQYGRIDTLVNNAGIGMWARFDELKSLKPLEEIMRVNYFGALYMTFHALPHLKQTRGRIVGVASVASKNGVPTRTGYAASKHAMVGFLDSLRIELRGTGVTVTTVYPDFVVSGFHERVVGPDGKPLGKSPLQGGRIMSAEQCARITMRAMAQRRRDVLMSPRSKLGIWLKLIAPNLVDGIALRAIQRRR